jgi:hypothetical protein
MLVSKKLGVPSFAFNCNCEPYNLDRLGINGSYVSTQKDSIPHGNESDHEHSPLGEIAGYSNLNKYSLRSDKLETNHLGKHFVFSGCSQSFGIGVRNLDFLWSKIIYDAIGDGSGYFNIARPGLTITEIIYDIYMYSDMFSVPDKIFILFPDIRREPVFIENDSGLCFFQQCKIVLSSLIGLESFCKEKNIDLVYSTWDIQTSEILENSKLNNFTNVLDNEESILHYHTELQKDSHWTKKQNQYFANHIIGMLGHK